jgi:hypothetical protein
MFNTIFALKISSKSCDYSGFSELPKTSAGFSSVLKAFGNDFFSAIYSELVFQNFLKILHSNKTLI